MKYQKVFDGDTVSPYMNRPYKMRCCDCGLVHRLKFKIVKVKRRMKNGYWEGVKAPPGYKVTFTAYRDVLATAACRRKQK